LLQTSGAAGKVVVFGTMTGALDLRTKLESDAALRTTITAMLETVAAVVPIVIATLAPDDTRTGSE
jgi:hypothetical protein